MNYILKHFPSYARLSRGGGRFGEIWRFSKWEIEFGYFGMIFEKELNDVLNFLVWLLDSFFFSRVSIFRPEFYLWSCQRGPLVRRARLRGWRGSCAPPSSPPPRPRQTFFCAQTGCLGRSKAAKEKARQKNVNSFVRVRAAAAQNPNLNRVIGIPRITHSISCLFCSRKSWRGASLEQQRPREKRRKRWK